MSVNIDCHIHLSCRQVVEHYAAYRGMGYEEMRSALRGGPKRPGAAAHNISGEAQMLDIDAAAMVQRWHEMLDTAGIAQGVFMGFAPSCDYMREVCALSGGRLHAFTSVVPTQADAAEAVRRDVANGFVGVKLYPVVRRFRVNDPAAYEVYRAAEEMGVPVLIHFGFSTDPTADLAYGNPLDLNPVARDFPEVSFVVAHFGAGYFREVLALGYQVPNVHVDTSGTNNWTRYMPYQLSLKDVFAKAFDTLGVERVLFGTDSGGGHSGYRTSVLGAQLDVLEQLGLSATERDLVMAGNAQRVMRLPASHGAAS